MIKLVYVIVRKDGMSAADFRDYWLTRHGPLVAAQAEVLRLRRYVQSHPFDDAASEAMRSVRGMLPPVDGVTEVWWDSLEDFQAAYATPEGQAAGRVLAEDEAKFIDFSKSQIWDASTVAALDSIQMKYRQHDVAVVFTGLDERSRAFHARLSGNLNVG